MASLFCTECGSKNLYTLNKPKFCQSCGNPVGASISRAKVNLVKSTHLEPEEENESFRNISKLDYNVDYGNNQVTLGDVLNNPMNPRELSYSDKKIKGYKKLSKKAFEQESTAECGSSRSTDIDGG